LPLDTRPCIASMLKESSSREGIKPLIIACELARVGKTEKQVELQLRRLNVKESDIRGLIRGAFKRKYPYSCPRLEAEGICKEKNRFDCRWFQKLSKRSGARFRERDFWHYRWTHKLTPAEGLMYMAIIEIEHIRGYKAGTIIYASRDHLADISGISEKWTTKVCENLADKGLIEFSKGRQHKHYGRASRIKRIIPIPRTKQ